MKAHELSETAAYLRSLILKMTTQAGSGHATSSLSAVELMAGLMFGGIFRFDIRQAENENNDRLIFSKGHASPLFYALWAAAGGIPAEELRHYREFGSALEGHPTPNFKFAEAATGSLGQGLSVGVGTALAGKLSKRSYTTYVLLGDSELTEGQVWEAAQLAAHYKLDNLVAIADINRLGQRGETMYGHQLGEYEKRFAAFGWETIVIKDGHSLSEIAAAFKKAGGVRGKPVILIAKTIKGKGVSFLENKDGWHGKALTQPELESALAQLGEVKQQTAPVLPPDQAKHQTLESQAIPEPTYTLGEQVATRKAYGTALTRIYPKYPAIVALDGEVGNSTYAEIFAKKYPQRFFEMFIAEQNMASTAVGLAKRGNIPFVSTFAAFYTRAFDQIRMAAYSQAHIVFAGSHAGVEIGQDGPSQMGLEDLALFRTVFGSTVLYPSDAVSTERLVERGATAEGIVYLRTTRSETPVLYPNDEEFMIGGSKTLRGGHSDQATIVAAGITVFEALKAYEALKKKNIFVRVIDAYSIKPIDVKTLERAAKETQGIIVVEDHYPEGGLADALRCALDDTRVPIASLTARKLPRSGAREDLMNYEEINAEAIERAVRAQLNKQ